MGFISAFSFKFSPRPGTPAATMAGQIPEEVKSDRLTALQALLDRRQKTFNESMVGQEVTVLIERQGRHAGQLVGRSPFMQPVHFTGPAFEDAVGKLATVSITGAFANSLYADLLAVEGDLPHHLRDDAFAAPSSKKVESRV